jgi:hypothetical protein
MAGYVSIGYPVVKTGFVEETNGLGTGMFVEMANATKKVTLADDETPMSDLYFTGNVKRNQYVSDDATAVLAKGAMIDCAALDNNDEIIFNVESATGYTAGVKLVMGSAGVLEPIGTTAGTYKVLALVLSAMELYGLPAVEARMITPYDVTISG